MTIEEMNKVTGGTPSPTTQGISVSQMQQIMSGGKISPDSASAALGHSTGMLGNILSTGGAIAGGIGGAALGGLAGAETGPGAAVTGYIGGVAGAGAGAAGGEALAQKIEGLPTDMGDIAKTGGINAAFEAVGGPILSAGGKALEAIKQPIVSGIGKIGSKIGEMFGAKGAGEMISNKISAREASSVTKALTPRLTPSSVEEGIVNAAKKGSEFEASSMRSVRNASKAIYNVASALGKKTSDIVQSGVKKSIENASNIGTAISDYSKNIVSPFLQKSGVNYNFADLQKALGVVKPSTDLKGEALSAYNSVRQKMLSAIANKVSPSVTGGKNLQELTSMAEDGVIPAKVMKGDEDFWDARKIIDSVADEATKGKAFGDKELQGAKAAYKDMRDGFARYLSDAFKYPGQMEKVNAANDFLGTQATKSMDKTGWNISDFEKQFGLQSSKQSEAMMDEWKQHMSNLSGLYDGLENVVTKGKQEYGKSWSELFAKENPKTASTLKYGAEAIGAGAMYEGAKGIGVPLP